MATLIKAPIEAVDANPFRRTGEYPYVERKLEALQRSIAEVGLWEGVIAREVGNRYEIAFGHHRLEAARRSKLTEISVIVRELSDQDMLAFMGRENLEDYNADFLTMLETWEAARGWLSRRDRGENLQPLEIARLLGWTRIHKDGHEMINDTAMACNAAAQLIQGEHIERKDLVDLTVSEARDICQRAQATMEHLKKMAKVTKRPAAEIAQAKKHVGKAVKETARQSRAGQVAKKDLAAKVDLNTYRFAKEAQRPSPLFEVFGKRLADSLSKMLDGDTAAEKLAEVQKAIPQVTLDDDRLILRRLDYELEQLGDRAGIWRKRLTPTDKKVSHLQISGDGR